MSRRTQFALKRLFDVFVAVVGLLALFPVLALVTLAIAIDSQGGPFFKLRVAGRDGQTFDQWKFRTMVKGARNIAHPFETFAGDPRITRVGRFLRRWSFDELPQLWNVLWGNMSLVGPRPAFAEVAAQYSGRDARRLRMRPGITGLAQIQGRNLISWQRRIVFDLAYIERWSLGLDFAILLRTIPVLIRGEGIYGVDGRVRMHDLA
ncbi:MAG TPA: sugar transferase [Candidatus Limnocylindrales bacterium]|nr:sugar transferase [Candidatus Limnocylindrales bacterium]